MRFDAEEQWRIERTYLALKLHKLPEEIDEMPPQDAEDILNFGAELTDKKE